MSPGWLRFFATGFGVAAVRVADPGSLWTTRYLIALILMNIATSIAEHAGKIA